MFNLKDKCALITGASGGIGGAIAKQLHAQGAIVGLSGRNEEALQKLANEIGSNCHVIIGSLDNAESTAEVLKKAEEAMGQVDILVNNAGITKDNLALRMKDEDWQSVLDVNLSASFRLSRAVLRGMMKRRWGRIINITSVVGVTGNPGQANYCASKAGLIGMSKSMAMEIANRGITINCVAPGFIRTAMTDELNKAQQESILSNIPAGAMGVPEDIASSVVYLASDEAGYMTGQTLHVNGGMAMIQLITL